MGDRRETRDHHAVRCHNDQEGTEQETNVRSCPGAAGHGRPQCNDCCGACGGRRATRQGHHGDHDQRERQYAQPQQIVGQRAWHCRRNPDGAPHHRRPTEQRCGPAATALCQQQRAPDQHDRHHHADRIGTGHSPDTRHENRGDDGRRARGTAQNQRHPCHCETLDPHPDHVYRAPAHHTTNGVVTS